MSRKYKSLPEPSEDWATFVKVRLAVLYKALELLRITDEMTEHEDKITKVLNLIIKSVCFEYKIRRPSWDAKTDDGKRPDFTFDITDPMAETVETYFIDLHIECKCIGDDRSSSWHLNENYITNGIDRFDLESHKYGEGAYDGIMIGYIISSTKFKIQNEINEKLPKNIEKLTFATTEKVEQIKTKFNRKKVKPFDFTMHHIWADFSA